jgi:hypothetical protein
LAARLSAERHTVWIDEGELEIGDSLIQRIGQGLYECDYIVAVISHSSVHSRWVQKELQLAMTREIEGRIVRVLPVVIESCTDAMPFFLRDKLYADFTAPGTHEDALRRLLRALGTQRPTLQNTPEWAPSPILGGVPEVHAPSFAALVADAKMRYGRTALIAAAGYVLLAVLTIALLDRSDRWPAVGMMVTAGCAGGFALSSALCGLLLRAAASADDAVARAFDQARVAPLAFTHQWNELLRQCRHCGSAKAALYCWAGAHILMIATIVLGATSIVALGHLLLREATRLR